MGGNGDGYRYKLTFQFANHGERPVMDVHAEIWAGADSLDQRSRSGVHDTVVLPGQEQLYLVAVATPEPEFSLGAWRVRWTDADGRQWYVDRLQHVDKQRPEPQPFKGQSPRRYPS